MYKKNESGQAAIIIALALVAMIAFVALAIDAGNAYTAKREAQNAADAAALAATRQLVLECSLGGDGAVAGRIRARADELVGANNADVSKAEVYYTLQAADGYTRSGYQVQEGVDVPCGCGVGSAMGVEIVVSNPTESFLAGIVGVEALGAKATGKARYAPVATVGTGLYPFTRRNDQPMEFGQLVKVRVSDRNDDPNDAPGNFGWLSWNGENNTPNLAESLTPPGDSGAKYFNPGTPENNFTPDLNDKLIAVGKWVQGAPGNKNANAVRDQLDWHIANQDVMVIPLYDTYAGEGSHYNYRVSAFAGFQLQSYDLGGNDKYLMGKFVRWVTSGDWLQGTCSAADSIYSVKLTP